MTRKPKMAMGVKLPARSYEKKPAVNAHAGDRGKVAVKKASVPIDHSLGSSGEGMSHGGGFPDANLLSIKPKRFPLGKPMGGKQVSAPEGGFPASAAKLINVGGSKKFKAE